MNISGFSISACTLVITLIAVQSCQKDDEQSFNLPFFDQIVVQDAIFLEISPGDEQRVITSGSQNSSGVNFAVNNQVLTISGFAGSGTVRITQPDLSAVTVLNNSAVAFSETFRTSSNHFRLEGWNGGFLLSNHPFLVDSLTVNLADDARLAMDSLVADFLDLGQKDGTRCNLEGRARRQYIDMNNSCRFNLDFDQMGDEVEAPIRGDSVFINVDNGAEAWIKSTYYLNAVGDHGSKVYYAGQPVVIDSSMTNNAELLPKGD